MSGAQYRLGPLLGAGGMAEVYYGQAQGVDGFLSPVAIKKVRSAHLADPEFLAAFSAEAKLAARLSHPNIVRVVDYQLDASGAPFIVMEYVYGRDLSALRRKGALPCSVAVYVVGEMLRGLAYAHNLPTTAGLRGVVHRDISPQNVLLSWHGEVKISDFGIARAFSTSHLAQSATIKGKPGYMSPEQISSEPLDGRSDLFSVGVVFWELLTGVSLFDAMTYRETMARVLYRQIPRPSQEAPTPIPSDVEAVVMRLLERDVSARYTSAEDAISDLLACESAPRNGIKELADCLAARCEKPRSFTPKMGLAITPPPSGAESSPQAMAMTASTPSAAGISMEGRRTHTMEVPATGPHDKTLVPGTQEPWHALTQQPPVSAVLPPPAPPRAPRRAARWAALGVALAMLSGLAVVLARMGPWSSAPAAGPTLPAPNDRANEAPLATSSAVAAPAPAAPPSASPDTGAPAPVPASEEPGEQTNKPSAPEQRKGRGKRSPNAPPPPESARPDRIVDIKLGGG